MVFCQHFLLFDWDKFLEKTDIIKEKAEKKKNLGKIFAKFLVYCYYYPDSEKRYLLHRILHWRRFICICMSYSFMSYLSIYLSFSVRRDDIVVKQDC